MVGDKTCEVPKQSEGAVTSSHVAEEALCAIELPAGKDTSSGIIPAAGEFEFVNAELDTTNKSLVDENNQRLMTSEADLAKAEDIRKTLNPEWWQNLVTLGNAVDTQRLYDTLSGLRQEDFARVAQVYESLDNTGSLMDDVRKVMPPTDFARLEAKLGAGADGTNFAGDVNVALVMSFNSSSSPEAAGRQLRATFSGMTSEDIARAQQEWEQNYAARYEGQSFIEAIKSSNIPDVDKSLIESLYMKGQDAVKPEDIVGAVRQVTTDVAYDHIPEEYGLDVVQSLIGSDAAAVKAARESLSADANFGLLYSTAFKDMPLADSYLQHGQATVMDQVSAYKGWHPFSDTVGNIDDEIAFAKPEDRAMYLKGQELASTPDDGLSEDQLQAKQYYQELHASFLSVGGSEDQAVLWSDKLKYSGGTMVSSLVDAHMSGNLTDQMLKVSIEQMSEADWNRLHDESGAESPFMSDLKGLLARYSSNPQVAQELEGLLEQVADAPSHAEVSIASGDLMDVLIENEGPSGDPFKIADAVAHMSAADVAKYLDAADPSFKEEVDSIVYGTVWPTRDFHFGNEGGEAAMLYAQMMLKQVSETGKPPVEGPIETAVRRVMNGEIDTSDMNEIADRSERIDAMMQIYANPQYKEMLDKMHADPYYEPTLFDRTLMGTMERFDPSTMNVALSNMLEGNGMALGPAVLGDDAAPQGLTDYSSRFEMSKDNEGAYQHEYEFLGADKQKVQDVINAQNGETLPVDYARIYDIGDSTARNGVFQSETFRDTLAHLATLDQSGRDQFMAEYQQKYGEPFGSDFIARAVAENNDERYTTLLHQIESQGYDIELEDMMRLAVLDGGESYRSFEGALSHLQPEQVESLKSSYAAKYGADMEADVLSLAGGNYADSIILSNLLSSKETDPIQDFLDRTYNFSKDGMVVDPTQDQVLGALQRNADLIQQYAALKETLPPEALQAVQDYFRASLRNNLDTKENVAALAQNALNAIVIAGTIATCWSGVTGAVGLGVVLGTAANRTSLMKYIEGGTLTKEEEIALGIQSSIDIGGTVGVNLLANTARAAFSAYKAGTPLSEALETATETIASANASNRAAAPVIRASTEAAEAPVEIAPTAVANNLDTAAVVAEELPAAKAATEANVALDVAPVNNAVNAMEVKPATTVVAQEIPEQMTLNQAKAVPEIIDAAADLAVFAPKGAVVAENASEIVEDTLNFEPQTETVVAPTKALPTEELIAMATVRRGEGPWQTAERILAAGGGTYGIDEVRALTKAIKALYVADSNNPDIAGLKVNHQFITANNFDQLIDSVNNEAVESALKGLAMAS